MKRSKSCTCILSAALACLILSASIAAPILCRPFYYAQIQPLNIPQQTGLTAAQIRQAYDEMLDFCLGAPQFSAGVLGWSESGRAHFADVRVLFLADLAVLALSALVLLGALMVCRRRRLLPYRFLGRGPGFWSAAGLGTVFTVVGVLASVNFDRAFQVFHALFFPGKDNWIFDPSADPIILILPETFFMHCALLILGLLLVWCAALIAVDIWLGRRQASAR